MNYLCNALQFSTSTELWISCFILIWFSCRNYLAIVSYHWKDHWGIIDIRESICAGGRASPEVYIWSARATTIPPRVVQQCYNHPSESGTPVLQLSLRVLQQCYNFPSEVLQRYVYMCYNPPSTATVLQLQELQNALCYNYSSKCYNNNNAIARVFFHPPLVSVEQKSCTWCCLRSLRYPVIHCIY